MGGEPVARVVRVRALARYPDVCRVDVEGAGTFRLSAATAQELGLREGVELEAAAVTRLREADARQYARAVALRLLERRLRSRAELAAALRRRGIPRVVTLAVVDELRRSGWIDDARFARAWARDRLTVRPAGPRRLRAELRAKGVASEIADEAIAALLPEGAEDALAAGQARARLRRLRGVPPVVARRRLAAWLQRRGYASDVVWRALRSLESRQPDGPDADPS